MTEKGLFCGVNRPKDDAAKTDFEKKHQPVIECPDVVVAGEPFTLTLRVGEIPHVTEEGHFIQWAEVKSGENLYARVEFSPVMAKAEATVTLVKGAKHDRATLRVLARCNLHGLWEAAKDITVQEKIS